MKFSKLLFILGFAICSSSFAQTIPVVEIDSVTVLDDQKVNITWKASSDTRVDGYLIYRVIVNNLGEPKFIDPVIADDNGRLTTNLIYQDQTNEIDNPSSKILRFFVQAYDTESNEESPLDSNAVKPHQTILLKNNIDVCNSTAYLSWNRYSNANNGWSNGVVYYEIWESQNAGPYAKIWSGTGTSYIRPNLTSGIDYKFKVRALCTDLVKSSTSNVKQLSGAFNAYPSYVYLNNATVNADNRRIAVSWTTDTTEMRLTYQIMMSNDSVNYVEIARFDSVPYQRFRDTTLANLLPDRKDYFFKIITSCSCPDTLDTTAVTRVIRLKAQYVDPTTNILTWNTYQGWLQGVGYYELFRIKYDPISKTQNSTLLATLFPQDNSYIDTDPELIGADNTVSYYIRAQEQVGNPIMTTTQQTRSNMAYVYTETKIVIPDVFTPNGLNPIFRPQLLTSTTSDFSMQLFNRWGKLVYETIDEFKGWDGKDKDNGQTCPPGSYIYIIKAKDSTGKELKKVGTVALLD